jgi:hypothetical protein
VVQSLEQFILETIRAHPTDTEAFNISSGKIKSYEDDIAAVKIGN